MSLYLLPLVILFACSENESYREVIDYDFDNPNAVLELDKDLNEISGLTWYNGKLLSLADEKGEIFVIDPSSGKIIDDFEFDKSGDYEGICAVGETIYALQSDGDIFKLEGLKGKKVDESDREKTGLDEDCEGLCYNPSTGYFYIACKDKAESADRAIYTLPLDRKGKPKERFLLNAEDIKDKVLNNPLDKSAFKIREAFSSSDNGGIINPSGLAIHPITKDIYVLSGTSSILVVLSPEGDLKTVAPLPQSLLVQPEGIAFSPNGDLYISSEKAESSKARILKFNYDE